MVRPSVVGSSLLVVALAVIPFCVGADAKGVALQAFDFTGSNGANPAAGLLPTVSNTAVGTTFNGGGTGCGGNGCGTLFQITTTGAETLLYAFQGGSDGENPASELFADIQGNLYGTTEYGGGSGCGGNGCGTIFVVATTGQEEIVPFAGGRDGAFPLAGLTAPNSEYLYGTTSAGGGTGCGGNGCGTVFQISQSGVETVTHAFKGGKDGADPVAQLIADSKGNLYGTTKGGGGSGCDGVGCGTVFEITASGTEKVLYAFRGKKDGATPEGRLTLESDGGLAGTTYAGGAGGVGTVFQLDSKGNETILHSFAGGSSDGARPAAGLLPGAGKSKLLFGTTEAGGGTGCGGAGCGAIYEIDESGKEKMLYAFTGSSDGASPASDLLGSGKGGKAATHGYLYGTAYEGGSGCSRSGCGTVFTLEY